MLLRRVFTGWEDLGSAGYEAESCTGAGSHAFRKFQRMLFRHLTRDVVFMYSGHPVAPIRFGGSASSTSGQKMIYVLGAFGSWNGLKIFGIESCTDRTMRMASAHLAVVQDARARSGQSIGTSAGRIN